MKIPILLFTAVSMVLAASARATLSLNYAGSFGPATTLGGIPLGEETPFSFEAQFESTSNFYTLLPPEAVPNLGLFPITSFWLQLGGETYHAPPSSSLNVALLIMKKSPEAPTLYGVGIAASAGTFPDGFPLGFLSFFLAANPSFSAIAPTPLTLDDFLATVDSMTDDEGVPYVLALDGVTGGLVINEFGMSPVTASLTAVPEPGNALVLAGLIGSAGFLRCRRRAGATSQPHNA